MSRKLHVLCVHRLVLIGFMVGWLWGTGSESVCVRRGGRLRVFRLYG